jgi:hypothetical protein
MSIQLVLIFLKIEITDNNNFMIKQIQFNYSKYLLFQLPKLFNLVHAKFKRPF